MGFGNRLKEARIARGMTQQELADRLEISVNSIANYERGISFPKEDYLYKIFNFLGFDPNYMFQDRIDINAGFWFEEIQVIEEYRSLKQPEKLYINSVLRHEVDKSTQKNILANVETDSIKLNVTESIFGTISKCSSGEKLTLPSKPENADIAVKVYGDAMKPELLSGDIIFLKYMPDISVGSYGLYEINGYAVVCRKLSNALAALDGRIFNNCFQKNSPVLYGKIITIYKKR